MTFYLELLKAQSIKRNKDGIPYSWRGGQLIEKFTDPAVFMDYVRDHAAELKHAVAFSGSASRLNSANAFLADQLIRAGVIRLPKKELKIDAEKEFSV